MHETFAQRSMCRSSRNGGWLITFRNSSFVADYVGDTSGREIASHFESRNISVVVQRCVMVKALPIFARDS